MPEEPKNAVLDLANEPKIVVEPSSNSEISNHVSYVEAQSYKKVIEPSQSLMDDYESIKKEAPTPVFTKPIPVPPLSNNIKVEAVQDKKTKGKKKYIFAALISLGILLLSGSSSFAAMSWYQNPQKVINDALFSLITTNASIYTGKVTITGSNIKILIDITAKQNGLVAGSLATKVTATISGKDYNVNVDALADKNGDIYVKLQNLNEVANVAENSLGLTATSPISVSVNNLTKKIDNTWIKITADDLKPYNSNISTSKTCINDAMKKFASDKVATSEVFDLYQKHSFIIMDKNLGQKDGSFGYKLKIDGAASKLFSEGLVKTKIYQSIYSCDNSLAINNDSGNNTSTSTSPYANNVEVWANIWTHQVTKLVASSTNSDKQGIEATLVPQYNQKVTITTPTTSITVTQLQSYIQELTTSIQSSMSTSGL